MKEENNILRKVGTESPFKVPEGYFENFAEELMNRLPEKDTAYLQEEPTLWQRVKPWLYMTAMFCGLMLSFRLFIGDAPKEDTSIARTETEEISEEEWEVIANSSMTDDYSLYEYLIANAE